VVRRATFRQARGAVVPLLAQLLEGASAVAGGSPDAPTELPQ
jgi:hypothetical protein